MDTKNCPYCTQPVHPQAIVCKHCKANIGGPPPGHPPPPPPPPRKDSSTKVIILILVLVLGLPCLITVAAVGVLVFVAQESVEMAEQHQAEANSKADLTRLSYLIEEFKLNHRRYPDKLDNLYQKPPWIKAEDWPSSGYLQDRRAITDPWERSYIYRVPGTGGEPFDLISYGSDGQEGGTGSAKDIWNHPNH